MPDYIEDKNGVVRWRKAACKHGHVFDGTERWSFNWRGYGCRVCKECARLRMARKRSNPDFKANEAAKMRRWRKDNLERATVVARRAYAKRDTWLQSFKTKCKYCDEFRYPCLDFHHREPKHKDVTIGQARHWSRARLAREIVKCDIVCANCHRWLHWVEHQQKRESR